MCIALRSKIFKSKTKINITSTQTRFTIHEDWTVVLLGSLIIILALAGFLLPVPVFGWKDSAVFYRDAIRHLKTYLNALLKLLVMLRHPLTIC